MSDQTAIDDLLVEFVRRAHTNTICVGEGEEEYYVLTVLDQQHDLLPICLVGHHEDRTARVPLFATKSSAILLVEAAKATYGQPPNDARVSTNEYTMAVVMTRSLSQAYRRQYLDSRQSATRVSVVSIPSPPIPSPVLHSDHADLGTAIHLYDAAGEGHRYSRKVFIGAVNSNNSIRNELRNRLDEMGHIINFHQPRASTSPPTPSKMSPEESVNYANYIFVVFATEASVHRLVTACSADRDDQLMLHLGENNVHVHVRVWQLADNEFIHHHSLWHVPALTQWTVHVDNLPRPFRAMDVRQALSLAGVDNIIYVGLETDLNRSMACAPIDSSFVQSHQQPHMLVHYPRVAARVMLGTAHDYINALTRVRQVHMLTNRSRAVLVIRPYIAHGGTVKCTDCALGVATIYCAHISCLQYYCHACHDQIHTKVLNGDMYTVDHRAIKIVTDVEGTGELPSCCDVDMEMNTYRHRNRMGGEDKKEMMALTTTTPHAPALHDGRPPKKSSDVRYDLRRHRRRLFN